MARKKHKQLDAAEPDLTPMIDCVFLLLIFFMIITEITQNEIEVMELPSAEFSKPDEEPPRDRLIVNVVKERLNDPQFRAGKYVVRGRPLSPPELIAILTEEADQSREPDTGFSDRPVLIRCDRRVEYRYFQEILMMMANPDLNIKMYKIEIAISKQAGDE